MNRLILLNVQAEYLDVDRTGLVQRIIKYIDIQQNIETITIFRVITPLLKGEYSHDKYRPQEFIPANLNFRADEVIDCPSSDLTGKVAEYLSKDDYTYLIGGMMLDQSLPSILDEMKSKKKKQNKVVILDELSEVASLCKEEKKEFVQRITKEYKNVFTRSLSM